MFTGIVQSLGEVTHNSQQKLTIRAPDLFGELDLGRSIAVNGTCLTLTELNPRSEEFSAEVSPETRTRTTLGSLARGEVVNLELPLQLSQRLDGHFVLGHVDTIGELVSIVRQANAHLYTFGVPAEFDKYLIEKGSIALDGISLTVFHVKAGRFDVAVISHTLRVTNLHQKRPGAKVNVEFDVLGKYLEKLLTKGGREFSYATGND
jgi:riboflavin synthase